MRSARCRLTKTDTYGVVCGRVHVAMVRHVGHRALYVSARAVSPPSAMAETFPRTVTALLPP